MIARRTIKWKRRVHHIGGGKKRTAGLGDEGEEGAARLADPGFRVNAAHAPRVLRTGMGLALLFFVPVLSPLAQSQATRADHHERVRCSNGIAARARLNASGRCRGKNG